MYGQDAHASMYATMMHSDSGYLVTTPDGKASYSGYLTWDDHAPAAAKVHTARKAAAPATLQPVVALSRGSGALKSLNGCLPFGCISNAGE